MAIFLLLHQSSKSSIGFVDKYEAMVAPGSVQLYSEVMLQVRSLPEEYSAQKSGVLSATPFLKNIFT